MRQWISHIRGTVVANTGYVGVSFYDFVESRQILTTERSVQMSVPQIKSKCHRENFIMCLKALVSVGEWRVFYGKEESI